MDHDVFNTIRVANISMDNISMDNTSMDNGTLAVDGALQNARSRGGVRDYACSDLAMLKFCYD